MSKDIKFIYQDCGMCGSRKDWGEQQKQVARANGINIIMTPFFTNGCEGLMWKAVEAGIDSYPFYTDGKKFSKNIEDFIEKTKKSRKKTKKVKESSEDGAISEN